MPHAPSVGDSQLSSSKLNVVFLQIDSNCAEALEIEILNIVRRRLKYHLKLRVLVEPVGIFAVAAVGWAAARLHVDDAIRIGPEHAQESFRVHRAGADFDIVRLLKDAVAAASSILQASAEDPET